MQVDGRDVVLRYSEPNPHGILDFEAHLRGTEPTPLNPARLYPNLEGSEFSLVRFRRPGQSDEHFASDAEWIGSDMLRLKSFLEKDCPQRPMYRSHIVALSIGRPVDEVFRFFIEPRNYPRWATLSGKRYEYRGGRDWLAETAAGPRIVRFAEPNAHGVLDFAVFAEGEEPVAFPTRVVANGQGTLLLHTLFTHAGENDGTFEWVIDSATTDLMNAKVLLEG